MSIDKTFESEINHLNKLNKTVAELRQKVDVLHHDVGEMKKDRATGKLLPTKDIALDRFEAKSDCALDEVYYLDDLWKFIERQYKSHSGIMQTYKVDKTVFDRLVDVLSYEKRSTVSIAHHVIEIVHNLGILIIIEDVG